MRDEVTVGVTVSLNSKAGANVEVSAAINATGDSIKVVTIVETKEPTQRLLRTTHPRRGRRVNF